MFRSIPLLSLLILSSGCEDSESMASTGSTEAATPPSDSSPITDLETADQRVEVLFDPPSRELFCSTEAYGANAEVIRFHLGLWEDGRTRLVREDGFAHEFAPHSAGDRIGVSEVFTDAYVSWEDSYIDVEYGDFDYIWVSESWSNEGVWFGYISDWMELDFLEIGEDTDDSPVPTQNDGSIEIPVAHCGGTLIHCWEPDHAVTFEYDPDSGSCTNDDGEVGANHFPLPMVRDTGFGECADLRWTTLSEGDEVPGLPLREWNLRGADLESSSIQGVNIENSRLEGANLVNLRSMDSGSISGSIDDFTILPDGLCEASGEITPCP